MRIERLPAPLLVWGWEPLYPIYSIPSRLVGPHVRAVGRGGDARYRSPIHLPIAGYSCCRVAGRPLAAPLFRVVWIHLAVLLHLLEFALLAFLLRLLFLFLGFLLFLLGFVEKVHHCEELSGSHFRLPSNLLAVRAVRIVEPGGAAVFGAVDGMPDCGYIADVDISARSVDGEHAAFVHDSVADPFWEHIP